MAWLQKAVFVFLEEAVNMSDILEMAKLAKKASVVLATLPTPIKNAALQKGAEALLTGMDKILQANKQDVENAKKAGVRSAFIDRLTLTEERILSMAEGLRLLMTL